MGNLFTIHFWFNLRPEQLLSVYQKTFNGIILVFIISFLAFWFLKTKVRGLYGSIFDQLYSFCLVNAFVGVIIWFFNYEYVPFLSSRFWFLLWTIEIIAWAYFIIKDLRKIPEKRKKFTEEKEFKKYLP